MLRSCDEAEAYVASVCFKHGPPRLVGVELEWLLHRPDNPTAQSDTAELTAALGPYAPHSLDSSSASRLLSQGSAVTVEPGGQVELASTPRIELAHLLRTVRADARELHQRLAAAGLYPHPRAADSVRPPRRVLDLPRYQAMEQAFDRIGPLGRSGMCSTAAVQVCLDAGERAAVGRRWLALHALGPVLLAAFANSPRLHGASTGWKSSRMACWLSCDPARTSPPAGYDDDPGAGWAARVLSTPLLCVRNGDARWSTPTGVSFADWIDGALASRPTYDDLDYHVSTLFPPVRPRGHLEVRYVDAQPGQDWVLPIVVLAAAVATPATLEATLEACEPVLDRWWSAARHGLADRVLARAAAAVFELACATAPDLGAPRWVTERLVEVTTDRVQRARCPADLEDPA